MTKKEERVQNLSVKFKIKLTKKEYQSLQPEIDKLKLGQGLYAQLKQQGNKATITAGQFSTEQLRKSMDEFFQNKIPSKQRTIKIYTTEEGLKMYNEAMDKELKKITNNEHRKKLSFRSPFPKQAY